MRTLKFRSALSPTGRYRLLHGAAAQHRWLFLRMMATGKHPALWKRFQQMLLRAIQERRYRPVGDKADRNFNVRIIAATNEDLEVSVNEKRFRQDLLYRLHDFGITVPPLRDCQEDIMPLAEFFRDMANREAGV